MKSVFIKKQLIFLVCIIFIITIVFYFTEIKSFLTLEFLQQHQQSLMHFIDTNYGYAAFLYTTLYATIVFFMFSLTLLLTTLGGFLFGILPGTVLSIIGALIGGTASLLVIRYTLYNYLSKKYHDALEKFDRKFKKHGANYLLMLQLFPLTPLGLINTMAALSHVSLFTFWWTTVVGMLPVTLIGTFTGKKFATIHSAHEILSPSMIIVLSALSLLSALPMFVRAVKRYKRTRAQCK